jgi:hypothetical protein
MPVQIRKPAPDHVEPYSYQKAALPPTNSPPLNRLQQLICGGPWDLFTNLSLVYWVTDTTAPGNGYWIAWEDPDALIAAGVTIAP